jgi:hypothetical protein
MELDFSKILKLLGFAIFLFFFEKERGKKKSKVKRGGLGGGGGLFKPLQVILSLFATSPSFV